MLPHHHPTETLSSVYCLGRNLKQSWGIVFSLSTENTLPPEPLDVGVTVQVPANG